MMLGLLLAFFIINYLFDLSIDLMNYRHSMRSEKIRDVSERQRFRDYFRANFRLSQVSSAVSFIAVLVLLLTGAFGKLDIYLSGIVEGQVLRAVVFFMVIGFAADLLSLPFSIYRIFRIEERFGFNRTTVKTFIFDKLKSWLLAIILGAPLLALIVWIYLELPDAFWILASVTAAIIILLTTVLYTSVLLPLFNQLSPLGKGSLKAAIESFCEKTMFPVTELFIMDGSKRSTKANAFFSGLGHKKTIVLYDTLVNNYSEEEIVAVLAHEVGHYKKKHTRTMVFFSLAQTILMFFLLSLFLPSDTIAKALGGNVPDFQLGLTGFAILYAPLSTMLSTLMNILSRKHEYEADHFAKTHYHPQPLVSALEKLHSDALSNPDPHPAYVFIHYSHPPLYRRIERLMTGAEN